MFFLEIKLNKITQIFFIVILIIYLSIDSIFSFYGQEILRWVSLLSLLSLIVLMNLKTDNNISLFPKYFLVILLPIVLSIIWIEKDVAIYSLQRIISLLLCVFTFSIYFSSLSLSSLKSTFKLLAFVLNIFMLINFFMISLTNLEIGDFSGIYSNKNFLANLSANALVLSIIYYEKNKIYATSFIAINTLILIATGSRTAVIILSIFYICIFIKKIYSNIAKKKIFSLMFVLITFSLVFLNSNLDKIPALERLTNIQTENLDGSQGFSRSIIWEEAIPIILEKPLLGWGYSSVGYYTFINNTTIYPLWGIHNSYLLIIMELGFIGFLCFILFLFFIFKNIYIILNNNKIDMYFKYSLIGVFFVGLVSCFSESFIFSLGNPMSLIFWISIIGLYYSKVLAETD